MRRVIHRDLSIHNGRKTKKTNPDKLTFQKAFPYSNFSKLSLHITYVITYMYNEHPADSDITVHRTLFQSLSEKNKKCAIMKAIAAIVVDFTCFMKGILIVLKRIES